MSTKRYTSGTHRLVDPERTLERIRPHMEGVGVTRCADVTGLDSIGIPVYAAIRPRGLTVQVTNGKGARPVDAQVSALMEAIEVYHAEHPAPGSLRRSSARELRREPVEVPDPSLFPGFQAGAFFSPDYELDWIRGTDLTTEEPIWLPASAVHLCWPALYPFSSNGLASGNDRREATLHALYELLERDAIARLNVNGTLRITENCDVLDLATIDDPVLTQLVGAVERAGLKLVVLTLPSRAGVSTCWAATLDPRPLATSTMINFGFGAHLSPSVAASRAITEAAQARLTFIHGSREDIHDDLYTSGRTQERLFTYFDRLRPTGRWQDLTDHSTPNLVADLDLLLAALRREGYRRIALVDLTRPPYHIPVVKALVPGLLEAPF